MSKNPYDRYLNFDGELLPAQTVATLAPMTALQNLCIDETSEVVMTSLLDGRIWRVPYGGTAQLLTQIDGRPSGIAPAPDGGWLTFGWNVENKVTVYKIAADGQWEAFLDVPDAVFPNGAQRLPGGHYLFADSITGTIWDVDYFARTVSAWYQHPLLMPKAGEWSPALNGLRMFRGRLYLSNSSTSQLFAMKVQDGKPLGEPELIQSDIEMDDFAFDRDGNLYTGTHPFDVILKLTQSGELTRVAGPDEGVRGCPACCFGRRPGDETGLYVIADGGLFNPLSGGLKNAQLVRLETNVPGEPVDVF